jgi:autotransporter-associated beta strand protein
MTTNTPNHHLAQVTCSKPFQRCCFLFVAALLALAGRTQGATTATWTGASGGEWNTPANWDIGVPGAGTNALIPASTSVVYSLPMVAPSFARLTLLGTLNVNTAGFAIDETGSTGPVIAVGTNAAFNDNSTSGVIVTNATGGIYVTNGGSMTIASPMSFLMTNSTSSAGVNIGSSGNPSKGAALNISGTLTVDQRLTVSGVPSFIFVNGGTLNCLAGSGIVENNTDGNQRIGVINGQVNLGDFSVTRCSSGGGLMLTNGTVNATAIQIGTANSMAFSSVWGGVLTNTGLFTISDTPNITASGDRRSQFLVRGGTVVSTDPNGIIIANQSGLSSTPSASGGGLGGVLDVSSGTVIAEMLTLIKDNTITNAYAGFFLSGGAVYLGSGGLVLNTGAGHVGTSILLSGGTLGAKSDWSSSAKMTLTNTVTIKAADNVNAAHNISLSGVLSGGGNLTKTGSGTLTLSGANTYAGNTAVSAGSLVLGRTGAIPAGGGLTIGSSGNAATVDLAGFNAQVGTLAVGAGAIAVAQLITNSSTSNPVFLTFSNSSGSSSSYGGVIDDGLQHLSLQVLGGTLSLTGPNRYRGETVIAQGTLALKNPGILPNTPAIAVGTNSNGRFDVASLAGYSFPSGSVISGYGVVTGSVIAANCSIYPGTNASPGTLTFTNGLSLNGGVTAYFDLALDANSVSNDLIGVGGSLNLSGVNTIQVNPLSGTLLAGTYRLFKFGSLGSGGIPNFLLSGNVGNGLEAALKITSSEVDLVVSQGEGNSFVWQGDGSANQWDTTSTNWLLDITPMVFTNGAFVAFNDSTANTTVNLVGPLSPAAVTIDAASDYTFTGSGKLTGPMSVEKTNSGTLIILTANDYAGVTTIDQGVVQVGNGSVSGTLGSGALINNGGLVMESAGPVTLVNPMSGAGTLTQFGPGAVTLTATNSYSGLTTISGGTLQIGTGGTLGSGNVLDNSQLAFTSSGNCVVAGSITGAGGLSVSGTGALTLTANNGYGAGTTVSAGTLVVNNSTGSGTGSGTVAVNGTGKLAGTGTVSGPVNVSSGGAFSPGNPTGTLTVNNTLTLNAGSILTFALGTNSARSVVNGDLVLNGTLNVIDAGGLGNSTNALFTYGGNLTLGTVAFGSLPAGRLYSLDATNTPGKVNLIVGVIATNIASFPGAVGFGGKATGGRGGVVYHVTNLSDSGTGSFRDAVSKANRTVVFDIGGYVTLSNAVTVQDNITIAGQTAPGEGIGVMGREVSFGNATNVICRYFRFRQGDFDPDTGKSGINLGVGTNFIFDHISVEFAQWDNVDAVTCDTITIQNSIIANPIFQQFNAHIEQLNASFAWYNTIFANAHNRQPLAKINTIFVNNIVYNYEAGYTVADTSGVFSHDIINNYFITGPSTSNPSDDFFQMNNNQSIYSSGNLRDSSGNGTLNGSPTAPSGVIVLGSPWSPLTSQMPTLDATSAYKRDVSISGPLPRDQVDRLVLADVTSLGTSGQMWTSQSQTGLTNGGYGGINGGTAPVDTDGDGMPDYWETAMGLNPNNANDSTNLTLSGYTQLEVYLNWLGAPHATVPQNSFVDVNLWGYTSGFTNGTYSVSLPTNGTVAVLPDGHTARFTPSLGLLGLCSFKFTVVDGAGSTMSDNLTVLATQSSPALIPQIASVSASAGNVVLNCTGGSPNTGYYVLTSTNLTQWTRLATAYFDGGGNLLFTNSNSTDPAKFYRLQLP